MRKFKLVSGKFYKDLIEQLEFSKIKKLAEQQQQQQKKRIRLKLYIMSDVMRLKTKTFMT